MNTKWKACLQVGILAMALTASGIVITPTLAYAQTQSKERRDTRQETRQDARAKKAECKKGDEKSRAECRQEKRGTKQDARGTPPSEVKK